MARQAALQARRFWDTAGYVGEGGEVTLEGSPDFLRWQITVVGSWTFSLTGQRDCARFVADRKIDRVARFSNVEDAQLEREKQHHDR